MLQIGDTIHFFSDGRLILASFMKNYTCKYFSHVLNMFFLAYNNSSKLAPQINLSRSREELSPNALSGASYIKEQTPSNLEQYAAERLQASILHNWIQYLVSVGSHVWALPNVKPAHVCIFESPNSSHILCPIGCPTASTTKSPQIGHESHANEAPAECPHM